MDVGREITRGSGRDLTLAVLTITSEEDVINNIGEMGSRMIVGIVLLVFGDLIESLGHRSSWLVYNITESKN